MEEFILMQILVVPSCTSVYVFYSYIRIFMRDFTDVALLAKLSWGDLAIAYLWLFA